MDLQAEADASCDDVAVKQAVVPHWQDVPTSIKDRALEQGWTTPWQSIGDLAHLALTPFRLVAEAFGYSPPDFQIYAFLVVIFMVAIMLPGTYGDIVLIRRRTRTIGEVVGMDVSSDGPDTPIIEFQDVGGTSWRFTLELSVNATTAGIGASVAVIYDPLHPKRAREEGRWWAKIWRATIWYAIAVGLAVLVFWPGLIAWDPASLP